MAAISKNPEDEQVPGKVPARELGEAAKALPETLTFEEFCRLARFTARDNAKAGRRYQESTVVQFDVGTSPEGVRLYGDAYVKVNKFTTEFPAHKHPVKSFALCYMKRGKRIDSPPGLMSQRICQDHIAAVGNVAPIRGLTWSAILDCLGEGLTMTDLHLATLENEFPKGPPAAMPVISDGNTTVIAAFAGDAYWFQMDTS